ncbi:hypothetical protein CBU02nite_18260 [Clostridium butyricum]|uniref:Uncharacterized protein n=1 Tax=Clostridium butyricum TaxID=1492 RepID=A0A512TM32_CLOBU|nr:hypothetical protein CBU02nite_18260 [Clostridium butyricum]
MVTSISGFSSSNFSSNFLKVPIASALVKNTSTCLFPSLFILSDLPQPNRIDMDKVHRIE